MTAAEMTLRFGTVRVATCVRWPERDTATLALALADELSPADPRLPDAIVVGVYGAHPTLVQLEVVHWLAEHAGELGADREDMLVAGGARTAALALAVRDSGWPGLRRQLLVHPVFSPRCPMPVNLAGAPAATVVRRADRRDHGARYAARLRAAGVRVKEVDDARWL
jgi:acetyl esterase/lipase